MRPLQLQPRFLRQERHVWQQLRLHCHPPQREQEREMDERHLRVWEQRAAWWGPSSDRPADGSSLSEATQTLR
jgi:hypothetical protein